MTLTTTPPVNALSTDEEEEGRAERRAKRAVRFLMAGLALAAVAGMLSAWLFVRAERENSLYQWQVRTGIVADSRATDVARWLDDRVATLRALTQNMSLQLYMTSLVSGVGAEAVEGQYLRNLMEATAQRDGFLAPAQPVIKANVAPSGVAGLALVDAHGRTLIATAGMPTLPPEMNAALEQAAKGRPGFMDVQTGSAGIPLIGFALPVYGVQDDPAPHGQIGFVVGLLPLGHDLFERLVQPGDTATSAKNYLMRKTGNEIEYLSPLADGTEPLKRRLAADTPGLADAFALAHPWSFGERRNYAGIDVLVTSRVIPGFPWVLIRTVNSSEALAESESRLRTILVVLLMVVGALIAGASALW
ncbi:MAG: metal-dependent phosphohydrolase [Rhodospirillaceae bacterium]|nr:MAG: metal-dependent phosphohydrolase [Rhodospirillaceae bacterium]